MTTKVILNLENVMSRLGDDAELFRECVALFDADTPSRLVELEEAVQSGALHQVLESVHRLKGAFATIGAEDCCAEVEALDRWARIGNEDETIESLGRVRDAYVRLDRTLAPWRSPTA